VADVTYTLGRVGPTSLSDLQVVTSAAVTAPWIVDVLVSGATGYRCTVATGATACASAGPFAISGYNYLQVRVTGSGTTVSWRVTYRY